MQDMKCSKCGMTGHNKRTCMPRAISRKKKAAVCTSIAKTPKADSDNEHEKTGFKMKCLTAKVTEQDEKIKCLEAELFETKNKYYYLHLETRCFQGKFYGKRPVFLPPDGDGLRVDRFFDSGIARYALEIRDSSVFKSALSTV